MLPPQSMVYLLVPNDSNERVLHPGRIIESGAEDFVVEFEKQIAPVPGTDVNLYYDQNGRFMQQGASIIAFRDPPPVEPTEPFAAAPQHVAIRKSGQPVSAESRGSFRVSVAVLEISAEIDHDKKCRLVDISPEGFGAVTNTNYRLGSIASARIEFEGEVLDGRVRVQTVKTLKSGKLRCGFLVPSTEKKMRASLQKLTSLVQRMQLRRLKRSA